jgi:membrane-associated phospholipid phosphatase
VGGPAGAGELGVRPGVVVTAPVAAGLARVAAGCSAAFVLVAALVWAAWPPLVTFDQRWSSRAYDFTVTHPWCLSLSRLATSFADTVTITVLTALVCVACLVGRRRLLAFWLAVTVAGSALLNAVLKLGLEATRPASAGQLTPASGFSFPSGHTQAATVTYPAIVLVVGWLVFGPGIRARRVSASAVCVLVAAVGASRVLLGAHWPSDVLGGLLVGCAWLAGATLLLLRRHRWGTSPVGPTDGSP